MRPRQLPVVLLLMLGVAAAIGLAQVLFFVPDRGTDFWTFYDSALRWRQGQNPYAAANLNHPLLLPLFALFTPLPFHTALLVWNLGALIVGGICLWSIARSTSIDPGSLLLFVVGSAAGLLCVGLGQVGYLLMAIATLAWFADREGKSFRAGAWLGLLAMLKPFYGLFGLYLIWRKDWRACAGFAGALVAGTAASWLVVGFSTWRNWQTLLGSATWIEHGYNASVWGVGARFSSHAIHTLSLGLAVTVAIAIACSMSRDDVDRSYAVLGIGSMLLSPLGWLHYLLAFVGPTVAVLLRRPSRWLWVVGGLAVLPYKLATVDTVSWWQKAITEQWTLVLVAGVLLLVVLSPKQDTAFSVSGDR